MDNKIIEQIVNNETLQNTTQAVIDSINKQVLPNLENLDTVPKYAIDFYDRFQITLNTIDWFVILSIWIWWLILSILLTYWTYKFWTTSDDYRWDISWWGFMAFILMSINIITTYIWMWMIKDTVIKNIILNNTPEIRVAMEISDYTNIWK